jgi:signal-transduction protein with cAMP-binding, CBS, and nucleotidyltransferase domain
MNTSVIRYRVADFLKRHAPFDTVPETELIALAAKGRVKFHEADEYIHRLGQSKTPYVWFVQQGRVELLLERSEDQQLLDVAGEGDLLGLDRYVGDGSYRCSARTTTDVIVYALDAGAFELLMTRHPEVERYLEAHYSVTAATAGRASWLDAAAPTAAFLAERPVGPAEEMPELVVPFTTRDAVRVLLDHQVERARAGEAVLTAEDLALFCNYNPARLQRELRTGRTAAELGPFLQIAGRMVLDGLARPADVDDCARMATQLVSAATAACIRLAEQDAQAAGIERPKGRMAWFAYGTLARGELLRLIPPKVGVVFDDTRLGETTAASIYGTVVAGRVSDWLHRCGLHGAAARWPEGVHPCMALTEWRNFFASTIQRPAEQQLFERRTFFDIRPLSGEETMQTELLDWLGAQIRESRTLVPLLACDTLENLPPLTFFSGMVVGLDGSERRELDLASKLLHPISDAARVFALAAGHTQVNTLLRLETAAADFPGSAGVFRDAAEAYRVAMYQQAQAGGPSIDPGKLARLDQRVLKTAFASVFRLLELTTRHFSGYA